MPAFIVILKEKNVCPWKIRNQLLGTFVNKGEIPAFILCELYYWITKQMLESTIL